MANLNVDNTSTDPVNTSASELPAWERALQASGLSICGTPRDHRVIIAVDLVSQYGLTQQKAAALCGVGVRDISLQIRQRNGDAQVTA